MSGKNNAMKTAPIEDHRRPAIPTTASIERTQPKITQRQPNTAEKPSISVQPSLIWRSCPDSLVLGRIDVVVDTVTAFIPFLSRARGRNSTRPDYEMLNKVRVKGS